MHQRPPATEYAPYYAGYIEMIPDNVSIAEYLVEALAENEHFFKTIPADKHDFAYDEGKWTVKEVLGHMCDVERVFAYRAMRVCRGDKTPLPGFDHNGYVERAQFGLRSWRSLIEEYRHIRMSSISLVRQLQPEAKLLMGEASGFPVSVRALCYMIAGHEVHHVKILKERYL
ncbi:MAG: DinB family protein [Bacteroidota bacterium]